jgi:hypothetical protein
MGMIWGCFKAYYWLHELRQITRILYFFLPRITTDCTNYTDSNFFYHRLLLISPITRILYSSFNIPHSSFLLPRILTDCTNYTDSLFLFTTDYEHYTNYTDSLFVIRHFFLPRIITDYTNYTDSSFLIHHSSLIIRHSLIFAL